MTKILVVDDDLALSDVLAFAIRRAGFEVVNAHDSLSALEYFSKESPDLIILDWGLPRLDGLEVCTRIRNESDVPIIMLTARTTEEDRLIGLDLGADDYVTKPFSPKELAARVRAVLRRLPGETIQRGPEEVQHGRLTVNFLKHEASLAGKPLNLSPIEFKLLGALVREPDRVFSRADLIEKALGCDFEGFDRTIDVHILNLRRKLEPDPNHPRYVKTVYGVGYKFVRGAE